MKILLSLILLLNFKIKAQDVKIGTQTWTSKNLDVATYRNGDAIPQVQDKKAWAKLTTGAWCYYENNTANGTTYGKLYNWYAVNDPRGLAPKGYHIPTDAEWTTLTNYLVGEDAGVEMKSTTGWNEDGNGSNTSGFAGLPGGSRGGGGNFGDIGAFGYWWSSSEDDTDLAWYCQLFNYNGIVGSFRFFKQNGFSVRCLRDLSFTIKAQDVTIGTQTWTTKNLNVSTYRNGDKIPQVQDKTAWANLKTGAWCYYENKTANGTTYGKLYNWYAVSNPRGLAPSGYHVPTNAEWTTLTDNLGYEAGTKMKSTTGWNESTTGWYEDGNNTSGFAGLPGGFRSNNGYFYDIGGFGGWWSSSEDDSDYASDGTLVIKSKSNSTPEAWNRYFFNDNGNVDGGPADKREGFSVRCLKD